MFLEVTQNGDLVVNAISVAAKLICLIVSVVAAFAVLQVVKALCAWMVQSINSASSVGSKKFVSKLRYGSRKYDNLSGASPTKARTLMDIQRERDGQ